MVADARKESVVLIPLRDSVRTRTFPVVNVALILFNLGLFLYEISLSRRELADLVSLYGVVPARFGDLLRGSFVDTSTSIPLVTAMFLHGGWLHILGNMLYLWVFGDNIEDRLGHFRYLIFYLAAGILANLTHIYFNRGSEMPTIGASGAIAGVLGAYLISFPRARVLTLVPLGIFITTLEIPAIILLLFWFVLQVLNGLGANAAAQTVAWWAHVGGFVWGIALLLILRPAPKRRTYY